MVVRRLTLLVCAVAATCSFTTVSARSRSTFDFGWRFHLGQPADTNTANTANTAASLRNCSAGTPCDPAYDDTAWRQLAVPHDFVIEGQFDKNQNPNHGALATNTSWYAALQSCPSPVPLCAYVAISCRAVLVYVRAFDVTACVCLFQGVSACVRAA